jgi:8-oxo-dGTP diphosphatase
MTDECVAGALRRDGRLLLCRRAARRQWYPGVWDLPGGHVHPGEKTTAALARELSEELGIVIDEPSRAADAHIMGDELILAVWLVDEWNGEPRNAEPDEHDEIAWFKLEELAQLDLAHADYLGLFEELVFG